MISEQNDLRCGKLIVDSVIEDDGLEWTQMSPQGISAEIIYKLEEAS